MSVSGQAKELSAGMRISEPSVLAMKGASFALPVRGGDVPTPCHRGWGHLPAQEVLCPARHPPWPSPSPGEIRRGESSVHKKYSWKKKTKSINGIERQKNPCRVLPPLGTLSGNAEITRLGKAAAN